MSGSNTATGNNKSLRHDIAKAAHEITQPAPVNTGMFTIMNANKWTDKAKGAPTPNQLLNELWHEGEVCILFADTGAGKSIFTVQAAEHISGGTRIAGVRPTPPQPVLYIDFELTEKQREIRYSEKDPIDNTCFNHYKYSDSLYFGQIDPDQLPPPEFEKLGFEKWLRYSIENALVQTGAKILIVDNITFLSSEQEKAKDALPLMKELKELKNKYRLSLLCLAHTPKRDPSKPITRNDLQGSKMLINFCDSAFAIGESTTEKNIRYIKQIKERNTEKVYDSNNVMLFEIKKPTNFLHFSFIGFGAESDHLRVINETDKGQREKEIMNLHEQGKSCHYIGNAVNLSHTQVSRIINKITGNVNKS